MVNQRTPSSRTRLVARSRLYLAAVVTGGVVAGAGFTIAAAHADTSAAPAQHTVTSGPGGQRGDHVRAQRTRQARQTQQTQQTQRPTTTSAPSTPPVRSTPTQSTQQTQQTQPQRAGSSHAS